MKSNKCKDLYRQIADEIGISRTQVEEVCNSVFEFQAYIQGKVADKTKDYYPTVRIPFFATFTRDKGRAEAYKTYLSKKALEQQNIEGDGESSTNESL